MDGRRIYKNVRDEQGKIHYETQEQSAEKMPKSVKQLDRRKMLSKIAIQVRKSRRCSHKNKRTFQRRNNANIVRDENGKALIESRNEDRSFNTQSLYK